MSEGPRKRRKGLPRTTEEAQRQEDAAPSASPRRRQGLPRNPEATNVAVPIAPVPTDPVAESAITKRKPGRRRAGRLLGVVAATAVGLAVLVLLARWLRGLGFVEDFISRYPGEYELPASAPLGMPRWLNWSHFFNLFLMALILRTGLQIRHESRPPAYWAPKKDPDAKVSLTVWLHQSLDLLWVVNGVIYLVLLFATAQWMRIVPTSWEVFPNALSAVLQYISLDWPSDNGWVRYNSLQQLAYFTTVFIAAPLAMLTGLRMSLLWPKNRSWPPMKPVRALHGGVMLYFASFIVVHVALVFLTGPLRNLNHMFSGKGSTDPGRYASDFTGLVIFAVVAAILVAGLVAIAKPLLISPIASRFGRLSSR